MLTKTCTRCKIPKSFNKFSKQKIGRFGIASLCKKCRKKGAGIYRKTHKKEIKAYDKVYRNVRYKQRIKTDPKLKLNRNIKTVICSSLKGNKNGRH